MATISENIDKIQELLQNSAHLTETEKEDVLRWFDYAKMHLKAKKWSEDAILKSCASYVHKHGKLKASTFDNCGAGVRLPTRYVVERVFNMSCDEFCKTYFPTQEKYRNAEDYYQMPIEEVNRIFLEEYVRVKAMTLREYDIRRQKWKPSAVVVMHRNNLSWAKLRALLSLPGRKSGRKRHPHDATFCVKIHRI